MVTPSSVSFTDLVNPAYNSNVASYFPQPLLLSPHRITSAHPGAADSCVTPSGERPLAPERLNVYTTNQPHKDVLPKNEGAKALRCEICDINCNSKGMLENHLSGHKHRKKSKAQNPDSSMLDPVKTEHVEGAETRSVNNMDKGALPGLEEMCTTSSVSCRTQALFHQPVSMGKHALVETIHADNMNLLEVCASRASIQVCTVCNIFSYSQAALEKHLAGKTHARKVKHLDTVMSLPVRVDPIEVLKSNNSKPAGNCIPADPSSAVPVESMEIKEPGHSEGGTAMLSPKVCTICNIKCNSQKLFNGHIGGKKHASKVRSLGLNTHAPCLGKTGDGASKNIPSVQFQDHDPTVTSHADAKSDDASSIKLMVLQDNNPSDKSVVCMNSNGNLNHIPLTSPTDDNSTGQIYVSMDSNGINGATLQDYESDAIQRASKRGKNVQFAYCDVCKVYCTSSELLNTHVMGKKHLKQLEKLEKLEKGTKTPEIDNIVPTTVASAGYQDTNKSSVLELSMMVFNQVEVQKCTVNSENQNNMQEPSQDANIGCSLCNVVCNSQMMLSTHLAGRKHAAMLRRAAEIQIVNLGPQVAVSN